jgi:formamidopyrimidine-DNA glycosylase
MPELPEVAVNQKYFSKHCLHQKIEKIEVFHHDILQNTSEAELNKKLQGKEFISCKHYGKYLFAIADDTVGLAIHFGMTGKINYAVKPEKKAVSTHLIITFVNHHSLMYSDQRRLGKISLVGSLEDLITKRKLGPDATQVTREEFLKGLSKRKGKIKSVLLDQSFVAGIGNVYADEILFQARIHPESAIKNIKEEQLTTLYKSATMVMKKMVTLNAKRSELPEETYLIPHRQEDGICPRDHGKIEMVTVGGRSTYFCGVCQKKF